MSVVKLSVHKNNKMQKEKKRLRNSAKNDIRQMLSPENVAGYCIVTWSKDREASAAWNSTSESDVYSQDIPKFIKSTVRRINTLNDVEG